MKRERLILQARDAKTRKAVNATMTQNRLNRNDGEIDWIRKEAARRHTSISQVMRDALRAYRKLVSDAIAYELPIDPLGVDF